MPPTNIVIRKASPTDLAQLYILLRDKAEFDGMLAALTASEAELGAILSSHSPGCEFAVADMDGVLVGFVSYYSVFSTYAARPGLWMDDLFVDERFRGRGIGKELLKFVAAEAARRNCCKLEWSLLTSNSRGIAFYEREGAVVRENNRFAKLDESGITQLLAG
ncbi:MAG: GNAT family N-acetyltransferase [Steroidobacteraceae bacterium]